MGNFDTTSLTNTSQPSGSNTYKAQFRLIGVVINEAKKETAGFVIMNEQNFSTKAYTIPMTIWMINNYPFVNASLKPGASTKEDIIHTECSVDRLIKFNTNMKIIDNNKVIVIGEIFEKGKFSGYKVFASSGKIVELTEDELLRLYDRTSCDFVNAKIVNTLNRHISAIKKPFARIDKDTNIITHVQVDKNKYHERFRQRIIGSSRSYLMCMIRDSSKPISLSGMRSNGKVYPRRIANVLVNEIYPNYKISDRDLEILNNLKERIESLPECVKNTRSLNRSQHLLMASIFQFTAYIPGIKNSIKGESRAIYFNEESFSAALINNKIACKELIDLVSEIKNKYGEKQSKEDKRELARKRQIEKSMRNLPVIDHRNFRTAHEIASLGFAISEKNSGYLYTNERGKQYKLKFIGEDIADYNTWIAMCHNFGDINTITIIENRLKDLSLLLSDNPNYVEVFAKAERRVKNSSGEALINVFDKEDKYFIDIEHAYIAKLRGKDLNDHAKDIALKNDMMGNSSVGINYLRGIDKFKSILCGIEIMIGMLAIYNPILAKAYYDSRVKVAPVIFEHMLPNFDWDNPSTDYKLEDSFRVYYESGYKVYKVPVTNVGNNLVVNNIYLGSMTTSLLNNMLRQSKEDIYINYYKATRGYVHVDHPDFYKLASVLGMITSDLADMNTIRNELGILRSNSCC